jgi:hypothetical protein
MFCSWKRSCLFVCPFLGVSWLYLPPLVPLVHLLDSRSASLGSAIDTILVGRGQDLLPWKSLDSFLSRLHVETDAIVRGQSCPNHTSFEFTSARNVEVLGLPTVDSTCFRLGFTYTLTLVAKTASGLVQCRGGDYFEVMLNSATFRSRPR